MYNTTDFFFQYDLVYLTIIQKFRGNRLFLGKLEMKAVNKYWVSKIFTTGPRLARVLSNKKRITEIRSFFKIMLRYAFNINICIYIHTRSTLSRKCVRILENGETCVYSEFEGDLFCFDNFGSGKHKERLGKANLKFQANLVMEMSLHDNDFDTNSFVLQ